MASEKIVALIEEVKALTVIELSELVHALEEEFGVSAAAMAVAAPAGGGADGAGAGYLRRCGVQGQGYRQAWGYAYVRRASLFQQGYRKTHYSITTGSSQLYLWRGIDAC